MINESNLSTVVKIIYSELRVSLYEKRKNLLKNNCMKVFEAVLLCIQFFYLQFIYLTAKWFGKLIFGVKINFLITDTAQ